MASKLLRVESSVEIHFVNSDAESSLASPDFFQRTSDSIHSDPCSFDNVLITAAMKAIRVISR